MLVSVCIPYHLRPSQLLLTLQGLGNQRLGAHRLEVVIGTHATDENLRYLKHIGRLHPIRVVVANSSSPSTSALRNAALAAAKGDILVLLDCDVVLNPDVVAGHADLHERARPSRPNRVILGRVSAYDKLSSSISDDDKSLVPDRRLSLQLDDSPISWCLCWTGHLSVSRQVVDQHEILFDESFVGWGMEDQEWGYRLYERGFRFMFEPQLFGWHLPHPRDVALNLAQEQANLKRFLRKHPSFEVELVAAFGDTAAFKSYPYMVDVVGKLYFGRFNVVPMRKEILRCSGSMLFLGAPSEAPSCATWVLCPSANFSRDDGESCDDKRTIPLLGLATYFEDCEHDLALLSPRFLTLPGEIRKMVLAESSRVSRRVVQIPSADQVSL